VDDVVGLLKKRLDKLHLPIDLIVVSDHGMIAYKGEYTDLDKAADLAGLHTEASMLYSPDDAEAARILSEMQQHPSDKYKVYRRSEVPRDLHYDESPREGDPVIVPTGPYPIRAHANAKSPKSTRPTALGEHGFDPHTMPEMKAIFFAAGPDIRKGVRLDTFENVNVYDFIAELLGLTPAANDGHPEVLAPALKHSK
jgi:alkaline phosphatase D